MLAVTLYESSEDGRNVPSGGTQPPTSNNPTPPNSTVATGSRSSPPDNETNLTDQSGQSASILDESGSLNHGQPPPDRRTQATTVPHLSDDTLEINWRKANKFPDEADYIRFNKMGKVELEQLAKAGDIVAMSLYGGQLMNRAETSSQGQEILFDAAARGSIFALQELATRSGPGFPGGTIERQIAYRQVALSLGDILTVPFLAQDVSRASPEQYAMSQVLFADAIARLAALRMQRTGQGLTPNLRPLTNQRKK